MPDKFDEVARKAAVSLVREVIAKGRDVTAGVMVILDPRHGESEKMAIADFMRDGLPEHEARRRLSIEIAEAARLGTLATVATWQTESSVLELMKMMGGDTSMFSQWLSAKCPQGLVRVAIISDLDVVLCVVPYAAIGQA